MKYEDMCRKERYHFELIEQQQQELKDIKLLMIVLEGQEVDSKELIDINLLDEGMEAIIVGLKREIDLFAEEKSHEDLHNSIDIRPIELR
ncbi:unnamed protein product [Spirodela intermedia]|uniref:Uncharacterized protein n=1 Tax=Spirodela intermedia TaxID=51605 RepID=A0A7I8L1J1_SPIIN|nr:unnamed protein product [Spirodela intermedia]